jgi:hypothetical protein
VIKTPPGSIACVLTFSIGAQVAAPRPSFSTFLVTEIFYGKPAAPKLVAKGERMFRTRIRIGADNPVEFAGHYTLPKWGCGAGCNAFVIVDSMTGRIYDVPFSLVDLPNAWVEKHADEAHDRMAFRPDSSLMKIDACPNEMDCGLYDYVMVDGKGLELVRKELLPAEFQPTQ